MAMCRTTRGLFVWLVADGWCWFVLREKYCWLVAGGWFVLREKYCWLVADKPSEQGDDHTDSISSAQQHLAHLRISEYAGEAVEISRSFCLC
jgi:hypothetical protein